MVVRREAGRIDMTAQIRCARLAFLPRVLRSSPPHLLGILDTQLSSQRGWAAQLTDDLSWVADLILQCDAEAGMLGLLDRGLSDVMAFAFASPKMWKNFVKRVLRNMPLQRRPPTFVGPRPPMVSAILRAPVIPRLFVIFATSVDFKHVQLKV